MAIDITDFVMPQCVNFGSFKGGFDYQDFRGSGETQLTHIWQTGDVNEVSVSQRVGPPINGASAEEEVIEFPNGYKIKVNFEYRISGQNGYFFMTANWYDENGNLITRPTGISGVTVGGTASMMASTNVSFIYPHAYAKCFLNTVYYPQTNGGVSPPSNVKLSLICSGAVTQAQWDDTSSPGNDLHNFVGNASVNEYYDLRQYGSTAHQFGVWDLITFTAAGLNNFSNWLHDRGNQFEGDAFTPKGGGGGAPAGSDDTSEPGGGDGNYDDTSDPIDFPALPRGGALVSGAVRAHTMSATSIMLMMQELWSDTLFDIVNTWQRCITDPMDAIVSMHALPVAPQAEGLERIVIGNYYTNESGIKVTSEYVEVDCGQKVVPKYWCSALDYSPYTMCEIFLPFIGVRKLKIEDVMGATLHIKYYIDVLTGDCTAFIKCGLSVLYHYSGNCKEDIPLSSISSDRLPKLLAGIGGVMAGAGTAVGGGAIAGASGYGAMGAELSGAGTAISSAANVATMKVPISRAGDLIGNWGIMDDYRPYLILHRPVQSLARDYNKFKGYPSNITAVLGTLSGYTEVEHINLQGIPNATGEEMVEIKRLLMGGVLL